MLKKLVCFAALVLTALLLVTAQAQADQPSALYRIVARTQEGDVTLGTGVLFGSKTMLLTVKGCLAEGDLAAIGADGEHAVVYRGEIAGTQLAILGLAEECAAEPMLVTRSGKLGDAVLYGADRQGAFVASQATRTRRTVIDQRAEVLIHAREGLMPGAVMLGDDGGLACITMWQHMEGEGVYAAIANVTLGRIVPADDEQAEKEAGPVLLRGFTARAKKGFITVDWSSVADDYDVTEDAVFTVYASVSGNPYLSYDVAEEGQTSMVLPAIPGSRAVIWVVLSYQEPEEPVYPNVAQDMLTIDVPAAEPFTAYGMRNLRCGLTFGEPGQEGAPADFLPQTPLTREILSDRSLSAYFQTEDAYEATQTDDDHVLMIALHTPEGYVFYYFSGYIFMPEMNGSDLWVADISSVFADYERFAGEDGCWPAGEYALMYYIDGCEAGRVLFTLE